MDEIKNFVFEKIGVLGLMDTTVDELSTDHHQILELAEHLEIGQVSNDGYFELDHMFEAELQV